MSRCEIGSFDLTDNHQAVGTDEPSTGTLQKIPGRVDGCRADRFKKSILYSDHLIIGTYLYHIMNERVIPEKKKNV